MRPLIILLLVLGAGCSATRLDPACVVINEQVAEIKAELTNADLPGWATDAPPVFQWYCFGELEYFDRDQQQLLEADAFKAAFMSDELQLFVRVRKLAEQADNCGLARTETDLLRKRAKDLVVDHLIPSLKLVQKIAAPQRYDYYWSMIVAAIHVSRQLDLLGAEYDVLPTVQAMLTEQLNYYLDTEYRKNHDMRYTKTTFFELLKNLSLLGGDVIDVPTLGPRVAKAMSFGYLWHNETKFDPGDANYVCNADILHTGPGREFPVRHEFTGNSFVQTPGEYLASLSGFATGTDGTGVLIDPITFRTSFHFDTFACSTPAVVGLTMTRWGPDAERYRFTNPTGTTEKTLANVCHAGAIGLLLNYNRVALVPQPEPSWEKYAWQGAVWRMKPPLINRTEKILDTLWSDTDGTTKLVVHVEAWHRPQ